MPPALEPLNLRNAWRTADQLADWLRHYGVSGPQGEIGPIGPRGWDGERGPAGADGATGETGPQGTAGAAGPKGDDGLHGSDGAAGATGATGPAGPVGPQGPADGVSSTVQTVGNVAASLGFTFLSATEVRLWDAIVVGRNAASTWGAAFNLRWVTRGIGKVGNDLLTVIARDHASWTCSSVFAYNGTAVLVTGENGQVVNWRTVVRSWAV